VTSLGDVLAAARALHDELDHVVEAVEDVWAQSQVDWIWFRLSAIGVVLRDRGGGPVAAVLARGLLEEAAYWDWALATGVGGDLVPRQAALELERLRRLAEKVGDAVWTGWLLPPGVSLGAPGTEGIPRTPPTPSTGWERASTRRASIRSGSRVCSPPTAWSRC
jgi:hypothetical protein